MQSQLQLYLKKLFIPLCLNLYLQLIKVFEFYTFLYDAFIASAL